MYMSLCLNLIEPRVEGPFRVSIIVALVYTVCELSRRLIIGLTISKIIASLLEVALESSLAIVFAAQTRNSARNIEVLATWISKTHLQEHFS